MKNNLGSILTAIDRPDDKKLEIVKAWAPAASMTFVMSKDRVPDGVGLRWQKSIKPRPVLKDALVYHLSRIRGREAIGVANPDVVIAPDFRRLYQAIDALRLQDTWAFRFEIDATPRMFVLSTTILPHMIRDAGELVFLDTQEWIWWMHEWLDRKILPHKYVDATEFGNVTEGLEKAEEPVLTPDPAPVAVEIAPEAETPVKPTGTPLEEKLDKAPEKPAKWIKKLQSFVR